MKYFLCDSTEKSQFDIIKPEKCPKSLIYDLFTIILWNDKKIVSKIWFLREINSLHLLHTLEKYFVKSIDDDIYWPFFFLREIHGTPIIS